MISVNELPTPADPEAWIYNLPQPSWDEYFMADVYRVLLRSVDQQTKQGCVIVDWPTKRSIATGYNGHPRGALPGLPTLRAGTPIPNTDQVQGKPDKYSAMVHCDVNALLNATATSVDAVMYLPMPPCEVCLGAIANHPTVKIHRIVYLEERGFTASKWLSEYIPHIKIEQYQGRHPADVLIDAAVYAKVRTTSGQQLSALSSKTYR